MTLERRKAAEERKRAEELEAQVRVGPIPFHPVLHCPARCQKSSAITAESWAFQEGCTLTISVGTQISQTPKYCVEKSSMCGK